MANIHFAKDRQWVIEAFDGLAFNELMAREFIAARMRNADAENVLRAVRKII